MYGSGHLGVIRAKIKCQNRLYSIVAAFMSCGRDEPFDLLVSQYRLSNQFFIFVKTNIERLKNNIL